MTLLFLSLVMLWCLGCVCSVELKLLKQRRAKLSEDHRKVSEQIRKAQDAHEVKPLK